MHKQFSCESYYYLVRNKYNEAIKQGPAQAARFVYLNKTCFNGIFRVNRENKFNVPYGRKEPPPLPTSSAVIAASEVLSVADLRLQPFEAVLEDAERGDFIYLDPPYPPLNGSAYFTHYTPDKFSVDDHGRLAELVGRLAKRGCKVLISNADTNEIRKLYKGFKMESVRVRRYVTCRGVKHEVNELIICTY